MRARPENTYRGVCMKQTVKYSLWRRKYETRKWERVESCAGYTKDVAVRVFQTRLLLGMFDQEYEFALRPVKDNGGV